jgi:galactokinase
MKDIVAVHLAEYEAPPACVASAPATVKLLGEHTASNDGIVLAAAISFEMKVAVSLRKDSSMRFFAADLGERKRASSSTLKYKREDRWANHVKSVYDYLSKLYDFQGKGINVTIGGNVPQGLGLGISAAINMATALALKTLFSLTIKNDELADLACKAQSVFMEQPVPIYDYLSCIGPGVRSLSIIDLRIPVPGRILESRAHGLQSAAHLGRGGAEAAQRRLQEMPPVSCAARRQDLAGHPHAGTRRSHGDTP